MTYKGFLSYETHITVNIVLGVLRAIYAFLLIGFSVYALIYAVQVDTLATVSCIILLVFGIISLVLSYLPYYFMKNVRNF